VPRFRFLLDDLSSQTDAGLRVRPRMSAGGKVVLLALKHGRDEVAVRIRLLAADGQAQAARDVLASILRYIVETSRAAPATVRELLAREVGREEAEKMLTTADMLRLEGEANGTRKALVVLLRQRFGRVPASARARIDGADAAELNAWLNRVLTASSLEDVLETPARAQPRPARQRARS
jgi:hypothetical protein